MSDNDYENDDFDDYEFEEFEDSETDDREESIGDVVEQNIDVEQLDNVDARVISESDHNLDSTTDHNKQVLENLKLNELSAITQEDVTSVQSNSNDTHVNTTDNNKKDIGENTMIHSISTEIRQMMKDEERQNKENLQMTTPLRGPESGLKGKHSNKNKKKMKKKSDDRVRSPVSFSTLLPGEEGITDNSSSLVEGGNYINNMSSIETQAPSPSKVFAGPGSETWKSQLDNYSRVHNKCIENEKKRAKGSRFIQSQVSHDSKHHRTTIERQLRAALQQVHSYRKENAYLTKMIDSSCIQSDFNAMRVKNEEQSLLIKQLTEERRALLLVQRNQEKTLLETEKEKESLPEQEHINQKKMLAFQKKVKTLRDNLYHYQVKSREEMAKNKILNEQNTKLKVKLKAMMISHSVAEQLKRDQLGLKNNDDDEYSSTLQSTFETVGVGDEATANKQESTTLVPEKEESLEELRSQRNKLKSIVDNQRASFRNQLVAVQVKLERSLIKRKELEDELLRREKEMKAQIFTVKELNKTCEELTQSNLELLEASSLYSKKMRRTVQSGPPIQVPSPRPPSHHSFTHRPSPVMTRPKEPVMANENENENTFLTGQSFEESDAK